MRRDIGILVAAVAVIALAGIPAADSPPVASLPQAPVEFTAAGDYGAGSATQAVLRKIAALAPDLNLALGNLSYAAAGTEQGWCDLVAQHVGTGFPFELIAGAQESGPGRASINDFSACLPNQLPGVVGTYGQQWYVDVPAQQPLVRFLLITPGLTFPAGADQYTTGSPRYAWTAAAIDGARAASIPWVVVGMNQGCLSTGSTTCKSGPDLLGLLVTKQVDLVLTSADPLYERSHQLALAPRCAAIAPGTADLDCIADDDSTFTKGAGTVFATVGTGGKAQSAINRADREAPYFAAVSGLDTATWGVLDVKATRTALSARFVRAAGGTFIDAFTIRPVGPDQNAPPAAAFTSECVLLACTVDGSSSTDPDGTVASYAWDFGDGSKGAGVTASHTYAAPGTYPLTLVATDSNARTASATRVVEVSPTPSGYLASDAFERSVASGFGAADLGGDWMAADSTSVTGGVGRLTLATKGAVAGARLPAIMGTSLTTQVTESWDQRPNGSGGWLVIRGRITAAGEYRLKVGHTAAGTVTARVVRTDGAGAETAITPETAVPGLTYSAGTAVTAIFEVSGTGPTALRAKIWGVATAQPTAWLIDTADGTGSLQVPGHPGLAALVSNTTTSLPVAVDVDDFSVTGPGGSPTP